MKSQMPGAGVMARIVLRAAMNMASPLSRTAVSAMGATALVGVTVATPARASADVAGVSKSVEALAGELRDLAASVASSTWQRPKEEIYTRRLVDAQVAFGAGRFDQAAILLFDYMSQTGLRDRDVATYYLAESLYRRHDYLSSQRYFGELVKEFPTSKHYQSSLERLIELAVDLGDQSAVTPWIAALDAIPAEKKRASAPYVRGKYAFATGNHADALTYFGQVKSGAALEYQARFYEGAVHVANKDLDKALAIYQALLKQRPRSGADRRIIELTQLAMGRIYYEQDQANAAIDTYLMIDRRSDLFSDALYEISWVYIKAQEYEKALRALELLALSDPTSSRLPTVRILEANLRVRKAQAVRSRIMVGIDTEAGNPSEEYDKAEKIFAGTAELYRPAHDELVAIVGENRDPRLFLVQITARATDELSSATMAELAAAWVRNEPEVKRLTVANHDLVDIEADLRTAEEMIARVDAALTVEHRVSLFPALAKKRLRALAMREELLAAYKALTVTAAPLEASLLSGGEAGELKPLREARERLEVALAELPGSDLPAQERVASARAEFDVLAQDAKAMQTQLDGMVTTATALRKYLATASPAPTAEERAAAERDLAEYDVEIERQRQELLALTRDIEVGRDQAGVSDEAALRRRDIIGALGTAYAAEFAVAVPVWSRNATLASAGGVISNGQVTWRDADALVARIDGLVDEQLVEVRAEIEQVRADLLAYRAEYHSTQGESDGIGADVLAMGFREVIAKFHEILIRSDVGVVDVLWSQREEVVGDLKRLTQERARELTHLRDEFRDLIEEDQAAKASAASGGSQP